MSTKPETIPEATTPETEAAVPAETAPAEPEGKKGKKKKKEDDYTNPNNRKFRMSVIVILVCVALLLAFLATFVFVGNTWFVKVTTENTDPDFPETTYSEEQISTAASAVKAYFHKEFPGCILQELNYSEEWSEETGDISFTGRYYAMFSGIDDIDDTSTMKSSKWHWDVNPDDYSVEYFRYKLTDPSATEAETSEE